MAFTTVHVPNVSDLLPAHNGEGLLLSGYAADWREDRVRDTINPYALDKAVEKFMATNPVLLWNHKLALPPVGKVLKAQIHRARGLWIEAILPRPADGTFAAEVWNAAKTGVLKAFSIGGRFFRREGKSGNPEIIGCDLSEISLCSVGVNGHTYAEDLRPTHVKSFDGVWYPASMTAGERVAVIIREHRLHMAELLVSVAKVHVAAASVRA